MPCSGLSSLFGIADGWFGPFGSIRYNRVGLTYMGFDLGPGYDSWTVQFILDLVD